jgi:endonuclease YncB( thermonuclease family)
MGLTAHRAAIRVAACIGFGIAVPSLAFAQASPRLSAFVTSVLDGDTIKVQLESGPMNVRLANIDAPEIGQAGGGAAARALDGRLLAKEVSLDVVTKDGQEQIVAVVYLGEENVNAWLVKQGHAWAYRQFTQDANYCVWENAARSLRRGLWAMPDWMPPWEWRQSKRDASFFASDYSRISSAGCIREMGKAQTFDD